FEDYRENQEGKAERVTVPETALGRNISDHNYAVLFSELRDQGYEVSISGDQMVSTEVEGSEDEMGIVIHGPEYGFTIT
ncbi:MAG: hypothetical protein ABEJ03_00005, partial [Candidatus Nanohaloarchaea archaeon]